VEHRALYKVETKVCWPHSDVVVLLSHCADVAAVVLCGRTVNEAVLGPKKSKGSDERSPVWCELTILFVSIQIFLLRISTASQRDQQWMVMVTIMKIRLITSGTFFSSNHTSCRIFGSFCLLFEGNFRVFRLPQRVANVTWASHSRTLHVAASQRQKKQAKEKQSTHLTPSSSKAFESIAMRSTLASRASLLRRLPSSRKKYGGSSAGGLLHLLLDPPEVVAPELRRNHKKREYHTTLHRPILPLILGGVAVAGGYVVYRKLQGASALPDEAARAKEAYQKLHPPQQEQHDLKNSPSKQERDHDEAKESRKEK